MFKKKSSEKQAKAKYTRPKMTRLQLTTHIILLVLLLLVIAVIWAVRYSNYYVNLFIDNYDGSATAIAELDGLERSDEESALLLPLQQEFDDWKQTQLRDEVSVSSADGLTLQGGLYDAGSEVTVILLHSFGGDSESSDYLFAPYYAAQGYNILLPDNRAHGQSDGDSCTYGLLEGEDVAVWAEWLLDYYGTDQKIILHGADLGANAALSAAAVMADTPALADNLCFVVAESPVVNLYSAARYLLNQQYHTVGFLTALCDLRASRSLGCSMKRVDLNSLAADAAVPVLVLQGTEDTLVDPEAVREYCDAHSELVTETVFADCAHGMVYATETDACEDALDRLIQQTVS